MFVILGTKIGGGVHREGDPGDVYHKGDGYGYFIRVDGYGRWRLAIFTFFMDRP